MTAIPVFPLSVPLSLSSSLPFFILFTLEILNANCKQDLYPDEQITYEQNLFYEYCLNFWPWLDNLTHYFHCPREIGR